ncbi:conserved hypothetical protein [Burkholderia cepacia]|nr:conserved hypothetical protein [Burkholderia cepacia]
MRKVRADAFFERAAKYLRGPFVYQGGKPQRGPASPAAFAPVLPFWRFRLPSLYRRCR